MPITVEELEILVRARVEEALKDLNKVKAQMQNLFNTPEMKAQIQQMQNALKQLATPMQKMQAESAKYQAMAQVAAQTVQQQVAKTLAAQAKAQAEQAKAQAVIDKAKAASEKAVAQQKAQEARNAQQVAQDRARAEEVIQQQRDIEEAVARATARLEQQNKSLSDGPIREPVNLTGAAPTVTPLGNVQDYLNKNADKYAASISRIREEIGKINGSVEADLEVLNRKIELLKQKLAQLKEAYEKALNAPNPDSSGLEKMEGQILNTEGQLNRMIRQSDQLAESLNRAEEAKNKLDSDAGKTDLGAGMDRVKTSTEKAITATKKYGTVAVKSAGKAKSAFLKLGQVIKRVLAAAVLYKGFRALFGFIKSGIESAISAPEIQNMFDVAFKNAAGSAEEFAQRLKKAFGVDIMESKQMLATMQNFTTSMGIGEKTSFKMSTSLTQLAYDMASLYEADPSQVFENMQSGLQGMPRAMYKYGVSLTAANIEQTALQYGLIKSGQEMTDQQKIIARYLTILKQTSNAQGDMARTMQSPANMLRVLKSQLTAAGRAIGNAFMPFIQAVLPWLNALAVLLERVGNALATFTYSLFGRDFKAEQKQQQNIAGGFGDIADAEKDVADNAKKAKNALAGFDELEVIQKDTNKDTGGAGSGGGYEWDVPTLDWPEGESPYEKMADTIVEKLKAIKNQMMDLGLDDVLDNFKNFFSELGKQVNSYDYGTALKNALLNGFESAMSSINAAQSIVFPIAIALDIPGIVYEAINTLSSLFAMLNDAVQAVTPGLQNFVNIGLVPIAEWAGGKIKDALVFLQEMFAKIRSWFTEHTDTFTQLGTVLGEVTGKLWDILSPIADESWESFKTILSGILEAMLGVGGAALGLWEKILNAVDSILLFLDSLGLLEPLMAIINTVIYAGGQVFSTFASILGQKLSGILEILGGLIQFLTGVFTGDWEQAWEGIKGIFTGIWDYIKATPEKAFNTIKNIWDKFSSELSISWEDTWNKIKQFFSDTWDKIVDFFNNLPERLGEIIGKILRKFTDFATSIKNWVTNDLPQIIDDIVEWFKSLPGKIWDALCGIIDKLGEWKDDAINWVKTEIPKIVDSIVDWFKQLPNKIWEAINDAKDWLTGKISSFFNGIFKGFTGGTSSGGNSSQSKNSKLDTYSFTSEHPRSIPALASGAVIKEPTLAMMGEYAGASSNPEIVAPQSMLYDLMVEANSPLVLAFAQKIDQVIEAIREIDPTLEIDGDVVGKTAQKYRENQFKRTGKVPV